MSKPLPSLVFALAGLLVNSAPSSAAKVDVAPNGSLRVDGRPFFPFGFFGNSGDAKYDVDTIGTAGFNIYHCNNVCDEDFYKLAASKGVYVVHEIWWQDVGVSVRSAREQKNLFAWYVGDDFNFDKGCQVPKYTPEELKARGTQVLAEDLAGAGRHATTGAAVGDSDCRVGNYKSALDFIQIESYPIGNYGAESTWLAKHASNARWALLELGPLYPFVANTQTFHWPSGRFPTAAEIWNMNVVSLIYGAKGFIAYSFSEGKENIVAAAPAVWAEMQREAAEMKFIAPFVTDGQRTLVTTNAANVHAALLSRGNEQLLLVANTSTQRHDNLLLNLSVAQNAKVSALLETRRGELVWDGTAMKGALPPQAAQAYVFRQVSTGVDAGGADAAKESSDQVPSDDQSVKEADGCSCALGHRGNMPGASVLFFVLIMFLRRLQKASR